MIASKRHLEDVLPASWRSKRCLEARIAPKRLQPDEGWTRISGPLKGRKVGRKRIMEEKEVGEEKKKESLRTPSAPRRGGGYI